AAVAAAKRCLAYWHDDVDHDAGACSDWINPVPDAGPYDMLDVLGALFDPDSFLALRAPFAPSVIAGFARLGGRSVGVLATNPACDEGVIDDLGAQKICRQVELCDAWRLPLIVLIDTLGTSTRWVTKDRSAISQPGLSRMHVRCIVAHQSRRVPLLSVQLRHGRGLAPSLLTGYSTGASVPVIALSWHSVELNRADGFALVRDPNAFDDVIEPAETRQRLMRLLHLLPKPRAPEAKHRSVDPW
ncbi:MAG: carboxyl transferase domain-containing protein, partial [Gammaproteobacteria bacterium]